MRPRTRPARSLREAPAIGVLCHVGLHDDGLAARIAAGLRGRLRFVRAAAVVDDDARAAGGDSRAQAGADAGRRAMVTMTTLPRKSMASPSLPVKRGARFDGLRRLAVVGGLRAAHHVLGLQVSSNASEALRSRR